MTATYNSGKLHAVSGLARYMATTAGADYICGTRKTQLAEFLIGRPDTTDEDQISHVRKDGALERARRGRTSLLGAVELDFAADPWIPSARRVTRPWP